MPFRSDQERRAAFARLRGLTPPSRPRLPDRLPGGGARGRKPHGPPTNEDVASLLRLDRPWLDYVLEGQLVTEDELERAGRLAETTPVLLAAYRAVRAYGLDRMVAEDVVAHRESNRARRAIENELLKRGVDADGLLRLNNTIDEALFQHATATDEDGEAT